MRTIGSPVLAQLRQHATKSKQAEVLTGLRVQSTVIPKPTTFITQHLVTHPLPVFQDGPSAESSFPWVHHRLL